MKSGKHIEDSVRSSVEILFFNSDMGSVKVSFWSFIEGSIRGSIMHLVKNSVFIRLKK